MRIEAYTQVQQLYSTKKNGQVQKKNASSFSDQLQISSLGKDIQIAKQAVAASPDVREALTAELKSRVDSGAYQVSSDDFAKKLLEAYNAAY